MLPALRVLRPHQRPILQARWNSSLNGSQGGDSNETNEQYAGILNVLHRTKDAQEKRTVISDVLNESTMPKTTTSDVDTMFDMNDLASSLSKIDQTPHQLHINATFNNTIVTLTRPNGSPLITTSGGTAGFKKAQRSGYEAAHQAAMQLLEKMQAKNLQVNNLHMILKGFGPGRDAAFKALVSGSTWNVGRITDATPIPFGGCRPKKARRL
ncbi:hypothetical protein DFQ28_003480 [Apophysomyces sp. BC1034]|nr:hypothetical protein DFQ30_003341 [Apophysomyces sp. BC1015]KAG0176341.1 hypothetical protein DFQ29_006266 [Apophysomyces sp. BC1021]KAG0189398.1 hypothetical protein DFQ28_003480 [Apophysomyces sp. BC1034]